MSSCQGEARHLRGCDMMPSTSCPNRVNNMPNPTSPCAPQWLVQAPDSLQACAQCSAAHADTADSWLVQIRPEGELVLAIAHRYVQPMPTSPLSLAILWHWLSPCVCLLATTEELLCCATVVAKQWQHAPQRSQQVREASACPHVHSIVASQ